MKLYFTVHLNLTVFLLLYTNSANSANKYRRDIKENTRFIGRISCVEEEKIMHQTKENDSLENCD